jgi:2,3-bisphosphoglycerate-independent phosphoglycerate mutase
MPEGPRVYPGLLLIGDGLGDRPCPELGGLTPAEAAATPTLDRLATSGESGLLDPVAPGVRGGSDTGHLSILGYDPYQYYTGRGPFEAMGIGLPVEGGDISFRCNFSTVDDQFTVLDRRAGRITERTGELARVLDEMRIEDVICRFKESVAHRAALVLHGPGLGVRVSDVDPHADGVRIHEARALVPGDPADEKTARIVNAFVKRSFELLNHHPVNEERRRQGLAPANIALPRGIGVTPHLRPFDELHGVKSACIVEVGLVKGIGQYLKMDVIDVPGATAGLDTDTEAIGRAVVAALRGHNFILCNVKGPDVAGHDGNVRGKVEIIERIDRMVGQILNDFGPDFIFAFSGDHSTPCSVGDHTGEPCPILFSGPTVRPDECQRFGERPSSRGSVGRIRGLNVVPIMTSYMGVQEKYGA